MQLTEEQLAAAHSLATTTYCSAAAGSGKTRTLVERVRWLVQDCHVDPKRICVVTFTNAAARELQLRLAQLGIDGLGHCGTLHALCLRLCNQSAGEAPVTVLTEEQAVSMLQEIGRQVGYRGSQKALREALRSILERPQEPPLVDLKTRTACKEMVSRMRSAREYTYDALLTEGAQALARKQPFSHLLVDEAQDSAPMDSSIYEMMECQSKFIIGDPNQAIYGFRGSNPEWFQDGCLEYADAFAELTVNYRSSCSVVAASQRLSTLLPVKVGSPTRPAPRAQDGEVRAGQFADEGKENAELLRRIQLGAGDSAAVLVRTNAAADRIRDFLVSAGVPVEQKDWRTQAAQPPLALSALQAMANPGSDRLVSDYVREREQDPAAVEVLRRAAASTCQSLARCAGLWECWQVLLPDPLAARALMTQWFARQSKCPPQLDMLQTADWIENLAWQVPAPFTLQELVLTALAPESRPETKPGQVFVGTVHSAKGLEWDRVLLPCFDAETWPGKKEGADLEEEIRLAYVAVTRARESVFMSCSLRKKNEFRNWVVEDRHPSPLMLEAAS